MRCDSMTCLLLKTSNFGLASSARPSDLIVTSCCLVNLKYVYPVKVISLHLIASFISSQTKQLSMFVCMDIRSLIKNLIDSTNT